LYQPLGPAGPKDKKIVITKTKVSGYKPKKLNRCDICGVIIPNDISLCNRCNDPDQEVKYFKNLDPLDGEDKEPCW